MTNRKNNYHNKYSADYTMGEMLYENYQKQRLIIMETANVANMMMLSNSNEHLFKYYAVLKTYFVEIAPYIVNEKDNFSKEQIERYNLKNYDKEPNKLGLYSAYENDFLHAMFKTFMDKYFEWKKKESEEKRKLIPFEIFDILTKIHVRLGYDSQWKLGIGINLSKKMSDSEKLRKAVLGFNA